MKDCLDHAFGQIIIRLGYHLFRLAIESLDRCLFFDVGIVLASLEHNYQVGEIVGLLAASKCIFMVLLKALVAKFLQNVEDDLRLYSSHSKRLQEAAHTLLNVALCVVLPLYVILEALLGFVVFAADNFCNFVETDATGQEQDFGCDLANLFQCHALIC